MCSGIFLAKRQIRPFPPHCLQIISPAIAAAPAARIGIPVATASPAFFDELTADAATMLELAEELVAELAASVVESGELVLETTKIEYGTNCPFSTKPLLAALTGIPPTRAPPPPTESRYPAI